VRVATTVLTSEDSGPRSDELSLLVMDAESAASQQLPALGALTIGRGDENDVPLTDPLVSRHHARLHVGAGGVFEIEDLDSANGTKVGEDRIPSKKRVRIRAGEPVLVGSTTLVVRHLPGQGRLLRAWPHAYFEARLEEEHARAHDSREAFGVVRLHVDGELAPGTVADVLAPALRKSDLLALYAPGEYELLLPSTPPELASAIAQNLVERLRARNAQGRAAIACYPRDGRTPEALLSLASERVRPASAAAASPGSSVVVEDESMRKLYQHAERIATGTITVLIVGETGVGKEIMAEAIHRLSPRARGHFLCLNCATLSDTLLESELFGHEKGAFTGATESKAGLLESAPGGTVFLDEVGEIPLPLQARLLRVLETREVTRVGAVKPRPIDVRFIAATNRDLERDCAMGRFRRDLYYRLKGTSLEMPALRARPSEILPMARTFIEQVSRDLGRAPLTLSSEVELLLRQYLWPGNIRELRNVIERAVLLCVGAEIAAEDLPPEIIEPGASWPGISSPGVTKAAEVSPESAAVVTAGVSAQGTQAIDAGKAGEGERDRIVRVLAECVGNQTRAAKRLGISRSSLIEKLELYQIPRPRKAVK
jgi:two-component system, NtrC family, response regulator AtoC